RDQHGPDNEVGPADRLQDVVAVAEERRHVERHDVGQVAQPVEVNVEDRDVRPQPGGDAGGVGAHDTAPDDRYVGRGDAGNPAQQDAAALERPFEELRPL